MKAEFKVQGMTCGGCERSVQNALTSHKGVGRRGLGRVHDAGGAGCADGGLRCTNPAASGRFAGSWVGAAGSLAAVAAGILG